MALYKHVANKEELLDGMVDIVFSEIELPSGDLEWRSAMQRRAISTREALQRHSWAIGMMESRHPGPANLRNHNAVMGCLRKAGFSFEMAVHAYSVQDAYIYGFALQEKDLGFETPDSAGDAAPLRSGWLQTLAPDEDQVHDAVRRPRHPPVPSSRCHYARAPGTSSLRPCLICSRSSGVSVCPCAVTACTTAASRTCSSLPAIVRSQPLSLGISRQSMYLRDIAPPSFRLLGMRTA